MVTTAKAIAAVPEIVAGKPKAVQGVGMLNKVVFGRDGNGDLFFKTDGKVPENMPRAPEEQAKE